MGSPEEERDPAGAPLAMALQEIADHPDHAFELSGLLDGDAAATDSLRGLLVGLSPFGLFKRPRDFSKVQVCSPQAADFLRSFATLIERGEILVDDWSRLGASCLDTDEILDRGVYLLHAIEHKRAQLPGQEPLRVVELARAIVTGRTQDGQPAFLLLLNEHSQKYQTIGGQMRPGETPEVALAREISEELPRTLLRRGTEYTMTPLEDATARFVSPTYGAYLEYRSHYFHVLFRVELVLSPGHRWVTLEELKMSSTHDGVGIVPEWSQFGFTERRLLELPVSLASPVEVSARPSAADTGGRRDPTVDSPRVSLGAATAAAAGLVFVTVISLALASRLAAGYFYPIVGLCLALVIVMLAFVARASGLIDSDQMVRVFRHHRRRANSPNSRS